LKIRDIVIIGMLSALHAVSILIKIPYGSGAMVHLGTAAFFTFALLFGRVYGGFSGGLGAALFDAFMGFGPYTIWSFVIKGIAGYIVGSIAHSRGMRGKSVPLNFAGCLLAAVWTLGGYVMAWTVVLGSFSAALANSPSSLISSGVGMAVALPLAMTLRVILTKAGILHTFQN